MTDVLNFINLSIEEKKKEYQRAYRKDYYIHQRDELLEQRKTDERLKEQSRAASKRYYEKNKERILAKSKEKRANQK